MAFSKFTIPTLLASASLVAGHGYVSSILADGTEYADPNIICHRDGSNAALTAPVTAGTDIELQWTPWPDAHHGPVITYLARATATAAWSINAHWDSSRSRKEGSSMGPVCPVNGRRMS
ncbi:Glycoside hydrolase family 61 [Penicillium alfredii]|uniref:Glycoside hydrolase family 61 n=1 Tax=Penicillium alfredii TaxID=1506179 RepID=A0A9W9F9G8_9EURO|nr:Glycoside hydrolase family 61 [Penicillium alfredii]KAJ5096087.1 Glycoside hydrolase family 61 [Penicillium alfredii]